MSPRSLLLALLALSGCALFGSVAPVATIDPNPAAVAERPGGLGSLDSVRYVVHVSVDGLRPDAVRRQPAEALPAFARLRTEAAQTQNARTDPDYRTTLPNHTAQLTGRPVLGARGHGWTVNVDPAPGATLHATRGAYVASAFDVAHDAGLATAAYVSKSKFSIFDASYDARHGAPDTTGADDGRDKIDRFVYEPDTEALVDRVVADLVESPAAYTFVHLRDPDATGHWWGWSVRRGSRYLRAVRRADGRLGRILDAIEADDRLRGRTAVVVTADHGGSGRHHLGERREHYTVPFYVWGPGVAPADLYVLNEDTRADPGAGNPGLGAALPPVRNGDAANVALGLLGLSPVPGSAWGVDAPLRVHGRGPVPELPPVSPPTETAAEPPRQRG
jgi:hypothetical protein